MWGSKKHNSPTAASGPLRTWTLHISRPQNKNKINGYKLLREIKILVLYARHHWCHITQKMKKQKSNIYIYTYIIFFNKLDSPVRSVLCTSGIGGFKREEPGMTMRKITLTEVLQCAVCGAVRVLPETHWARRCQPNSRSLWQTLPFWRQWSGGGASLSVVLRSPLQGYPQTRHW